MNKNFILQSNMNSFAILLHNNGRITYNRTVTWHILNQHTVGTNINIIPYSDASKHASTTTNRNIIANRRYISMIITKGDIVFYVQVLAT